MYCQPANDLNYFFSDRIVEKLKEKHDVTKQEVRECFNNSNGVVIEDSRKEHATIPPTQWFIALTDKGRELKVIYIFDEGTIYVKTAFDANQSSKDRFEKASM